MQPNSARLEKQAQNDAEYDDFSQDGETTSFLDRNHFKESAKRKGMTYLLLANLFVFTMSLLTLICAVYAQKSQSTYSAARLMDEFGVFSPAMNVVEYREVEFKLPSPVNSSKYVGVSQEVNNAWLDIAYVPDQMVTVNEFPKLKKPMDSLKVSDPRSDETGYRVGLEVFHQLQCLNLLRMATYPEHYTKLQSDESSKPEEVRAYLGECNQISPLRVPTNIVQDHCVEILRTKLMCASDVSVFTYHAVPGKQAPVPDYDSKHVCRNFDKIKQWATDNAVPAL
ncbi:uncharacterized protein N0V89_005285 [Didymosphaeria variabile]|uniref:Uncharacterized protein n=1 Tax=Didymosphaeria variabile TaxID=1932322 RepID=A0A9W9CB50_9PLEO|nr:uncharacterized protein N0V89_005285 [Didymosphaeria variabile]KAJ4353555.1 hypothetical protein N0V89_005285 [Didymosphaeria variabile]